jgi:hypothetical protein
MYRRSFRCVWSLLVCVFLISCACGAQQKNTDDTGSGGGEINMDKIQVYDFSGHFSYEALRVAYAAPQYGLPLDSGDITNFNIVASSLGLNPEVQALLLRNGFAVTGFTLNPSQDDVVSTYKTLSALRIPVLVTSASLLHVYHILFGDLLRSIEAQHLYDDLWNLSLGLFNHSRWIFRESDGDLREAGRRDAVFFAVGLSLLVPANDQIPEAPERGRFMPVELKDDFVPEDLDVYRFEIPDDIADAVTAELDLIRRHEGFHPSPLFKYEEDYSQYVPRGHYTRTEKLKNYFKAMMWFGRMSMLLKGSKEVSPGATCRTCDALISEHDARIQTLGAVIAASGMGGDAHLLDLWERIYRVTSFFVGFSDDLGPYEYLEAINQVVGRVDVHDSFDVEHYGQLKARLAEYRSPLIYGGTGDCMILPPFTPEQADACLAKTRGFRFMGQRFVPDSYVMSKLVAPNVGEFTGSSIPFTAFNVPGAGIARVFPRGLDVMAVLGSLRAREILDESEDTHYRDFDKAFAEIKAEIDAIEVQDWNQNLYWNWLWSLKGLLSEFGTGRPTFMRTEAWKDRLLTVALASWAELRHDTILYVKQSYTLALGAAPERMEGGGYVEPLPEFYNRLLSLTRMTRSGLEAMNILDDGSSRRLKQLETTLERLIEISLTELRGEELGPEISLWIAEFGDILEAIVSDLDDESLKTTVVADVHTDANSGMVLEEGSGYVDLMVAAWKDGNDIYLAAGPEFSYYEFKQPMSDRLTDEAWREMLETNPPERPSWVESYSH